MRLCEPRLIRTQPPALVCRERGGKDEPKSPDSEAVMNCQRPVAATVSRKDPARSININGLRAGGNGDPKSANPGQQ